MFNTQLAELPPYLPSEFGTLILRGISSACDSRKSNRVLSPWSDHFSDFNKIFGEVKKVLGRELNLKRLLYSCYKPESEIYKIRCLVDMLQPHKYGQV